MKRLLVLLAALSPLTLTLAACDTSPKPPGNAGVCYQYVEPKGQKPRFNVLSRNVATLEQCAANLEAMRIRFLSLGGSQTDIVGAYQAKFLFLRREGIFTADSLDGGQYPALVRTSDGRLAPPGSVSQ